MCPCPRGRKWRGINHLLIGIRISAGIRARSFSCQLRVGKAGTARPEQGAQLAPAVNEGSARSRQGIGPGSSPLGIVCSGTIPLPARPPMEHSTGKENTAPDSAGTSWSPYLIPGALISSGSLGASLPRGSPSNSPAAPGAPRVLARKIHSGITENVPEHAPGSASHPNPLPRLPGWEKQGINIGRAFPGPATATGAVPASVTSPWRHFWAPQSPLEACG